MWVGRLAYEASATCNQVSAAASVVAAAMLNTKPGGMRAEIQIVSLRVRSEIDRRFQVPINPTRKRPQLRLVQARARRR